jgi:hypothetical protein
MNAAHSVVTCLIRFLCLALLGSVVPCPRSGAVDAPTRLKRADSFLGVHFDFHAGEDCTKVGQRTTHEMVALVIDKVQPDYIQIDCKGHPGYSSYPTKVGNPAPGFVGDPLRVWRDMTRRRGVAVYMHHSGESRPFPRLARSWSRFDLPARRGR